MKLGSQPQVPDVVRQALDKAKIRKAERLERMRQRTLARISGQPTEITADRRPASHTIEKNKGLTRQRKKYEGNARVHNRVKYEKKLKKLKGIVPQLRECDSSGNYEGEQTGVKSNLKRSITIK